MFSLGFYLPSFLRKSCLVICSEVAQDNCNLKIGIKKTCKEQQSFSMEKKDGYYTVQLL